MKKSVSIGFITYLNNFMAPIFHATFERKFNLFGKRDQYL